MLLTDELYNYRDYVVDNMLALDDGALSQLVNVGNYTEAFMKGWKAWKQGNNEQAFQTFRLLQY